MSAAALVWFTWSAASVSAAPPMTSEVPDRLVCPTGDAREDCCSPAPTRCHSTVPEAVAAASDGEWIEIGAGVYVGGVGVFGLDLTLTGKRDTLPPILTTADREAKSVITVGGGASVVVRNLTVASPLGRAVDVLDGSSLTVEESFLATTAVFLFGGAASVQPGSTLVLRDTVIEGGVAASFGGQVYAEGADVVIERCTLAGGVAQLAGGAVAVREGGTLTVIDSTIDGASSYGDGGAIWVQGAAVTISGSTLSSNVAAGAGGAVALVGASAVVTDARLVDNVATRAGGAISADTISSLTLTRAKFEVNRSLDDGGGAVAWSGREGTVDATWSNLWFVENSCRKEGGAVLVEAAGALRIHRSGFLGNDAGGKGGAVAVGRLDALELHDNVVAGTRGGGAVHAPGAALACSGVWFDNAGGHIPATAECLEGPGNQVDVDPRLYAYSADGNVLNDDLGYNPRVSPLAGAGTLGGADLDGSAPDVGPAGGSEASEAVWSDQDGDGWPAVFDCNAAVATVHPGVEVDGIDGQDANCDGSDGVDLDRDGWSPPGDCDDLDPTVHPAAAEDEDLRVDRDCDGYVAPVHPVRAVGCRTAPGAGGWGALVLALSCAGLRPPRRRSAPAGSASAATQIGPGRICFSRDADRPRPVLLQP
jgi:hypothetical protein